MRAASLTLKTVSKRGDAFEVFCEAYLNTDEIVQSEEVWVGGKIPRKVRLHLNLPDETGKLGELVAY